MNFDLAVEQKLLKDSVRKFFSKESDGDLVRELIRDEKGYREDIWRKMAELGWMGLLVPRPYGEDEMSFLSMAVLLHEIGYACFPGPFFSTAVTGVLMLLAGGRETQKQAILPAVAGGNHLLALAIAENDAAYGTDGISLRAHRQNGDFILTGQKRFVPDAHVADTILCVAKADHKETGGDLDVFIVDGKSEGVKIELLKTFTGEKLCDVVFDHVWVPASNLLGGSSLSESTLNSVLLKAAVGKCAEMVGSAQRAMDMTVEHARKRAQFGRPVGAFQAVQHHCANMLTDLETSRYMMYQAAWRISEGFPFEKEASMCKAWVSDSCRHLIGLAHQVMGGLGFMEEIDLHLHFNRAKAMEQAFGDADLHRENVARQLGL
jgi:alkylation response protein AidB-like acyl-CoA dehydrogenase